MMTADDLRMVVGDLAASTKAYIAEYVTGALGTLRERVASLEAGLASVPLMPGPIGEKGIAGERGSDGAPGPRGEPGMPGPRGEPGERGADGLRGEKGDPGERGADGAPGEKGADGAPGLRGEMGAPGEKGLDGAPGRDGAIGEKGADGLPGRDGRDGVSLTVADLAPLIKAEIADRVVEAVKALPLPAPGRDGASVSVDDLRPVVATLIDAAISALPPARDGRDGLPGVPGPPGEKGEKGMDGMNGRDGSDGINGKDGADGLGFDNLDLKFTDTAGYVFVCESAGRTKEWPVAIPWDAGVWRQGRSYPQGAGVTFKGNWWIAQSSTFNRPSDTKDWRLSVRRGEDGKDAKRVDGQD